MYVLIIISILIATGNVGAIVGIGINMDGLLDWSNSQPYVDLVRQSRSWGTPSAPWIENATFDPITGWPTSDFGMVLVSNSDDLGGRYLLSAKGNADVKMTIRFQGHIENKTYDLATNTLSAIVFILQNTSGMVITFTNTTGPGLQNISLLQIGYNLTSKLDITKLMLAHLSRFSIIRFMDWTNTNANYDVNWNDTTPLSWPIYRPPYHNPWETIPLIINQLNTTTDVWINLPFNCTDDYILNVAGLMFKQLEPSTNIYVEFSNELWNTGFQQGKDNIRFANNSVNNHGDPLHLNYDNCSNPYYWAFRRTAYQTKHIADLFKTVFGEENVGQWKRVRPILAGQAVNIIVLMNGLDYLNIIHGPPSSFLHGIAIAPYFDLGEYRTWSNLTVDLVLDGLNSSIQEFLPENGWSRQAPLGVHATYAAWYGLMVYGYEGGPDMIGGCPSCSIDAKRSATRDRRIADLCVTYLNGWYQFGFQALNWFNGGARLIGNVVPYNLLEDMRQETLIDTTSMFNSSSAVAQLPRPAPKLKAIDDVRQSSIELNFGIPVPSYNVNATNFMQHNVPYPYPDLRNLAPNSTFYYPLQIHQSPIKINLTVYVAGSSGVLEAAINNEQFVQVVTPQTANTTTFQPTPVMQLNINQTIVPSVATLRLRNIQNGYSILKFDITPSTKDDRSNLTSSPGRSQ